MLRTAIVNIWRHHSCNEYSCAQNYICSYSKLGSNISPFSNFWPEVIATFQSPKLIYSPGNIYLYKVNNRSSWKRCDICPKLTIITLEQGHWRTDVFMVDFEHISHLFLVLLLLAFKQVTVSWEVAWSIKMVKLLYSSDLMLTTRQCIIKHQLCFRSFGEEHWK